MGTYAHIEPGGHITIDPYAWLEQRTAGALGELTSNLHWWAHTHDDTGTPLTHGDPRPGRRNWCATARSWCQAHGYETPEPDLISHTHTRLNGDLWILRAQTPNHEPIAVVGINTWMPIVYADYCSDPWEWFDADSVDIGCPAGHGWTWRTGRELIDAQGSFTTLTLAFGADLDAPFTPCPRCADHHDNPSIEPCHCDGQPWILCPTCGRRCDVELPTH
jgi:hypothetical protein